MKMKIKSTILGLAALLLAGMVEAQEGWNFPTDPALEKKARELMLLIQIIRVRISLSQLLTHCTGF